MANFNCEYCGNEFQAKPSAKRKYCSRECANKASKGHPQKSKVEKIEVVCANCGKTELVLPSRAKTYLCCCTECLGKYNSKRHSKKIECICPICNTTFELKPYRFNRVLSIPCCSKKCSSILKSKTFSGKGNHQFGLKGELNASFKGTETTKKNIHLEDIYVYCPERPDANKDGRITKHRLIVEENYKLFNINYFNIIEEYAVLKPGIHVHHIDQNHSNNSINNLIPVTMKAHTTIHNRLKILAVDTVLKLTGVFKWGELLENLEADNQQPSLDGNIFEGSETNNQVLSENSEDSNIDTSTLLYDVLDIMNDYIVRATNITKEIVELEDKELLG